MPPSSSVHGSPERAPKSSVVLLCESPETRPTFSPSSFVSPPSGSTVRFMLQKGASTGGAALAPNSVCEHGAVRAEEDDDVWRCWVNLLLLLWESLAAVWAYRLFRG